MNQANDCGPRARIVSLINWTSSVCNQKTSNVQRPTSNERKMQRFEFDVGCRALNVERLLSSSSTWILIGLAPKFRDQLLSSHRLRTPITHLMPPPGYRFRRPWYARPQFCVPAAIVALLISGFAIYLSILAS